MKNIVVPIGDARNVDRAAGQAIEIYRREPVHIHLLNVQHSLPRHISRFFSGSDLHDFHRDTGMKVLEPAMRLLDEAGVPHQDHVLVGPPAETIVRFAEQNRASEIVLDNRPARGLLSVFGLGSVASQVRHLMRGRVSDAPSPGTSSPS